MQKYLNRSGCQYLQSQGKNKDFDLFCLLHGERVEVKRDMKAPTTGNLCFEKALAATKSETVVYVIGPKAYLFKTAQLWPALVGLQKEGLTRFVLGGDRNANPLLIVKMGDILPFALEINLSEVE